MQQGEVYELTFDGRNSGTSQAGFDLYWNGQLVSSVANTSSASPTAFRYLVTAGVGSNDLRFVSTGPVDNYGVHLDNVRLYATQPLNDGYDTIDGGNGIDTIVATGDGTVIGLKSISNVEVIDGNGFANVSIAGSGNADSLDFSGMTLTDIAVIDGGDGDDTIIGSAGADVIEGALGDDVLDGGAGDDVFRFAAPGNRVAMPTAPTPIGTNLITNGSFEDLGAGGDSGYSWGIASSDMPGWTRINPQWFEAHNNGDSGIAATDGSYWLDMMSGGGVAARMDISQTISGFTGGQVLELKFDAAVQSQAGNADLEVLWNGNVVSHLTSFSGSMSTTTLFVTALDSDNVLSFRPTQGPDYYGIALDNIQLHATQPLSDGFDVIDGGAGNDMIVATGDGAIIGLQSIANVETISAGGFTNVTIAGSAGDNSFDFSTVTLTGITAIDGSDGNDTIIGSVAADTILGGLGDDRITGGAGDDIIDGGAGTDVAVFAGLQSDYSLVTNNGVTTVVDNQPSVDGDDGTDTLTNVEFAEFQGGVQVGLAAPIVLDLDGDGVELVARARSGTRFDWDGDSEADRTGWVGKDDGFLVYDRNHDGKVSGTNELSFIDDKPEAKSDLDGLSAFDSNGDGLFSAEDDAFADFRVWRDRNGNGRSDKGELMSLEDAGIASITLAGTAVNKTWDWSDNITINTGSFTWADGRSGALGDVARSAGQLAEAIAAFGADGGGDIIKLHDMEESRELVVAAAAIGERWHRSFL